MKGAIRFRTLWIWILLIGFALYMISSNSGLKRTWSPADELIVEICAPFQKFIKNTVNITEDFWLNYFYLINVRRDNTELLKEIDRLRMENDRYVDLLTTYERLQELLQFNYTINWPVLAVSVIGRDPTGWFKSVIIDKGEGSGLKLNMPVVNAHGVVGRIVSVSSNYATVLLIIDQKSAVDCLVRRSREGAMIKGLSNEICKLDYVVKSSSIVPGDLVVTSGLGGIFPKGLPVGEVSYMKDIPGELFKHIEVKPAVDFSKLEEILVILKETELLDHQTKEK